MKIYTIDKRKSFAGSTSRLSGGKITVNNEGIILDVPVFIDGEGPELVTSDFNQFSFAWDDILSKSEDNGFVLISSKAETNLSFTVEQVITQTFFTKSNPRAFKDDLLRLALIWTPAKTSSTENISIFVFDDGNLDVSSLDVIQELDTVSEVTSTQSVSISAPSEVTAGKDVELSIQQHIPGTTIYLEATSGMLARTRITTSGIVLLKTESLLPGEVIKVKAGYKYWTGESEVLIHLT